MRAFVLLIAVAACGGDDNSPVTCVPDGYWTFPADCEVAVCGDKVCDMTCETGMTCGEIDCQDSPQCRLDCQPGVTCGHMDCRGTGVCLLECHGEGATCDASCEGSQRCAITCTDGAACLLDCGSTPEAICHLDGCISGVVSCGNGVTVCNRPCP